MLHALMAKALKCQAVHLVPKVIKEMANYKTYASHLLGALKENLHLWYFFS